MAENKKGFLMYASYLELFEELDNESCGKLIKTIIRYVNDLNPEPDPDIKGVFILIKQQLKRDLNKWDDIKAKRSIAGKASADSKKQQKATKSTSVESVEQTSTKSTVDVDVDVDVINSNNLSVNWMGLVSQFNEITGKNVRVISDEVKRKIKARLKEGYSKQDIVDAITNCYNDQYHKETNHKYLTLEFISRPAKMEKYATMSTSAKKENIKEDKL